MRFTPIAIVGRACVLPGALTPEALWDAILAGQDLTSASAPGRWRMPKDEILGDAKAKAPERAWTDRGGYVTGFEDVFNPEGFALPAADVQALDPLCQWVLHTAREALGDLGAGKRVGATLGNLSLPSESLAAWAEAHWLDQQGPDFAGGRAREMAGVPRPDPRNRFMSGLPAHLLAEALGLDAGALALDAACASSLYALKLACDRLHDGEADVMLAGAVNRADDLFLHVGFSTLKAISPSGRSRPFHSEADGLIPAEGAAFVALKRLEDAIAEGDTIHGLIRGIGLSNDGRASGMLVPDREGQVRAIRGAYARAGLMPKDVSMLECHATGTTLGDATELESLGQVFTGGPVVPLGSIKSNMGHPITVAGMAGLLKILGAMNAGVRPPTIHTDAPTSALEGSGFRLLTAAEPWEVEGPRRAGLSAFGFGGNNAHIVIEEWVPGETHAKDTPERPSGDVAVIAIGARAGAGHDVGDFSRDLFGAEAATTHTAGPLELPIATLRFPPTDLRDTQPQQLQILLAAQEALAGLAPLPRNHTSVLVGMGCDTAIARYGLRWRLAHWLDQWVPGLSKGQADEWLSAARTAIYPELSPAGVVGSLPNVVTNRLNAQFDLAGPSYSVSAETLSGTQALTLALRALRAREINAAVVGGVDLSCEGAHAAAAAALLDPALHTPGDAAVVLVLKRLEDAQAAGDPVLAVFPDRPPAATAFALNLGVDQAGLTPRFGHAHAASGLLHVAAATLAVQHRARPLAPGRGASPALQGNKPKAVSVSVSEGRETHAFTLQASPGAATPLMLVARPRLHLFGGADAAALAALLAGGATQANEPGPARLVIVAEGAEDFMARRERALTYLKAGATGPAPDGVFFRATPVDGELAFVFTGAAAAYSGMGRELLLAFPKAVQQVGRRFDALEEAAGWVYDADVTEPTPLERLWGASLLSQVHAVISREVLELKPRAVLGLSSGETNALYAMGAWDRIDDLYHDFNAAGAFTQHLGGACEVLGDQAAAGWSTWRVAATPAMVRAAIADHPDVRLTLIMGPEDVVVAGAPAACKALFAALPGVSISALNYDVVAHAPELAPFSGTWRQLHHRPTQPVPGVRFYTHATLGSYMPTDDSAADALLGQALDTVDFPALVEQTYADGVRVFVEHGPQGGLAAAIRRVLGDRPHLAVSLDLASEPPVRQLARAAAALAAAGVPFDLDALNMSFSAGAQPPAPPSGPTVTYDAHAAAIRLPQLPTPQPAVSPAVPVRESVVPAARPAPAVAPAAQGTSSVTTQQRMALAPTLPSVMAEYAGGAAVAAAPALQLSPSTLMPAAPPAAAALAPSAAAAAVPPMQQRLHSLVDAQKNAQAGYMALLAQQAAVHQQFLVQSQAAFGGLMGMLQGQPPAGAAPVAPQAAVAQPAAPVSALPHAPGAQPSAAVAPIAQPSAPQSSAALPPAPAVGPPAPEPPEVAPRQAAPAPTPATVASAAAPPAMRIVPAVKGPSGPTYTRAQLETLASGRISDVFGAQFEQQDGFFRQVRMPEPPLLLADRVTGIVGVPGALVDPKAVKTGTIWTETDVRHDSWFLHDGAMPAGIMIESGQADLLMISWLGADFLNRSERVYRLLGCELTYHERPERGGVLPRPGETLAFDIHVDGHAKQGDIRMFFFHYDCRIDGHERLTVRHGQAGFFTDAELGESGGVLWSPEEQEIAPEARVDKPAVREIRRSFSSEQVQAFAEGRVVDCFGPDYFMAQTHTRTPRISGGDMRFLRTITDLDPQGGPWGRGYMRAVAPVTPDDWFFRGHFKNDPCMPGTLMFEGCLQGMAFYLAALGYALDRDGWRFEPVPEQKYLMRCRGQVMPSSKEMVYELFVEECHAGPEPMIYADLLVTVDGLKAFHCRRMGLRLKADFPLLAMPELTENHVEPRPVATSGAHRFNYPSLLACAWGRPSDAFGPAFERFDHGRRLPRLPGPPYHFISRVIHIDGELGVAKAGAGVEMEFDLDPNAWYFNQNGHRTMPYAVLLEAALQPCGWLACFIGTPLESDHDLFFRNLDGTATQLGELFPEDGVLTTKVTLKGIAKSAGIVIVSFKVACHAAGRPIYEMDTVFGFFPKASLASQAGLPPSDDERAALNAPSEFRVDLKAYPGKYFDSTLRLASGQLLMLDRVTGYWPEGGAKGIGRLRAEKDVKADDWFFKAHFFQDPVQPGSLGIEAMIQALQFTMLERRLGEGIENPRFEPVALDMAHSWKYRGQVQPFNGVITTEIELTDIGRDEKGVYAIAEAWLWVDGTRIYQGIKLGMRIVAGPPTDGGESAPGDVEVLDPALDTWLVDHQPTYVLPVLPFMSMVDRLAAAALRAGRPGQVVAALADVHVKRWVALAGGPLKLRTDVTPLDSASPHEAKSFEVTLSSWREAATAELSRYEPVATGRVLLADAYGDGAAPWDALKDAEPVPDPYASGSLFHGPAFHVLRSLSQGPTGASAVLNAQSGGPLGTLNQVLLDGLTHAIPNDTLSRWSLDITADVVGYPSRLSELSLHGPTPENGDVRCEVRFDGFEGGPRHPAFRFQLIAQDEVWAEGRLVSVLFPKGPLGQAAPAERRAFLAERRAVSGLALSRVDGEATRLSVNEVKGSDWLPGTLARLYGVSGELPELTRAIAAKEHLARRFGVHPGEIRLAADGLGGSPPGEPLALYPVNVTESAGEFVVVDAGAPMADMSPVSNYWEQRLGKKDWPVEDLYFGLIDRYVGRVIVTDPAAFAALESRPALFLANHQVGVESLLFSVITSGLIGQPTAILAKAEHQRSWLGQLITHNFAYPGVVDPRLIQFFDRSDPASLLPMMAELQAELAREGKSLMVHAAGTRSVRAADPVAQVSAAFIDLALAAGMPIVPVRFAGGLPSESVAERLEFPVGHTRQDYYYGTPLWPDDLRALPLAARKQAILDALNNLGPPLADETPNPPDSMFEAELKGFRVRTGLAEVPAVLFKALEHRTAPSDAVRAMLVDLRAGRQGLSDTPEQRWLARLADWLSGRVPLTNPQD